MQVAVRTKRPNRERVEWSPAPTIREIRLVGSVSPRPGWSIGQDVAIGGRPYRVAAIGGERDSLDSWCYAHFRAADADPR